MLLINALFLSVFLTKHGARVQFFQELLKIELKIGFYLLVAGRDVNGIIG